ncbi:hypothetical protein C8Q76DRAFT_748719 [Earliella scabrosa]|nr:hypothetical protein C8Q76DRAFT_748719 [Earliella scabrosa]
MSRRPDDHPHFLTYAAQLAGALRNMIFVDQVDVLAHIYNEPVNALIGRVLLLKDGGGDCPSRRAHHGKHCEDR